MRSILASALIVSAVAALGAQKMERPGITNYTKVDAVVACGGATETAALEGLKNDGFKAVINLRQATEQGANIEENAAQGQGARAQLHPHAVQRPGAGDQDGRRLPRGGRRTRRTSRCTSTAGRRNRVGAVWLVKRVLQDGWTVEKATEEAKMIGLRSAPLEKFALHLHRVAQEVAEPADDRVRDPRTGPAGPAGRRYPSTAPV